MVEIEFVLPEFRKRICPNCQVYSHIKGKYGLAGYVLLDPDTKIYYYLTYVRNPFFKENKQGVDRSILLEANARWKAIIVKSMRDENKILRFYACDAKGWYQWVTAHNSWYDPPYESEDLGNIPLVMLYDMENREVTLNDRI